MSEHPIVAAVLNDPVVKAVVNESVASHGTVMTPSGSLSASPNTTEEDDRVSAGQRAVNLIWENTQMKVALSVIWSSLFVAISLSIFGAWLGTPDVQLAAVVFLFGVANLVTGFYFGRTNHQKIGGVIQGR